MTIEEFFKIKLEYVHSQYSGSELETALTILTVARCDTESIQYRDLDYDRIKAELAELPSCDDPEETGHKLGKALYYASSS